MLLLAIPLAVIATAAIAEPVFYGDHHIRAEAALSPNETEIDVDSLELYAKYAATAYCNVDKEPGEPITCESNCGRAAEDGGIVWATYFGPATKYQAYTALVTTREQIIFIGKPSATEDDWAINLDYETIPSDLVEGGMVHRGFSNAWDDISEKVMDTIANATQTYPGYKIITAGHSLGGAVAAIAAAKLRAAGYEVDHYSYGSPRIGNDVLSDFISTQDGGVNYRTTLRGDPIPQVPPALAGEFLKYKYRHISPEYWFTGYPADPSHWPSEVARTCPGNLNFSCNSNPLKCVDIFDHGSYFGSMACMVNMPPGFVNGVYFPKPIQQTVQGLLDGETKAAAAAAEQIEGGD